MGDGFVVLRGFFSQEEVNELSTRAGATMTDWRPGSQWAGVQKNVDKIDPWFEERYHRGAHVPLLAGLIQDKPVCSSVAFFDKPPGSSVEISQHVDGPSGETGATIWAALDTADRGNGCLCYVKGSHLRSWSADELKALGEDSDGAFVFEAAPGDAIIHSARVVHWSRKSTCTTRRRRAVSCFYWTATCLEGRESWPGKPQKAGANEDSTAKKWATKELPAKKGQPLASIGLESKEPILGKTQKIGAKENWTAKKWTTQDLLAKKGQPLASIGLENKESMPGKIQMIGAKEGSTADVLGKLNIEAGEAALRALNRDWAAAPQALEKFHANPAKFLMGLELHDPEAFDIVLSAARS